MHRSVRRDPVIADVLGDGSGQAEEDGRCLERRRHRRRRRFGARGHRRALAHPWRGAALGSDFGRLRLEEVEARGRESSEAGGHLQDNEYDASARARHLWLVFV